MKKFPAFLLAQNKKACPDKLYIIHTRKPRFIAQAIATDLFNLEQVQKEHLVNINDVDYSIGAQTRVDGQLWALVVLEFYDNIDVDITSIGSGGLMSRMGDWFHAQIKA
jgi:hypothetical protein